MQVGTASGCENPTSYYFNQRGIWLTYVLVIFLAHLFILSMPFFTTAIAWTLTNVLHDIAMFVILHVTRGTPYMLDDAGTARKETQWEQLDQGKQFTPTKKFLTIVPIVLFFLASFYTKYDKVHFVINASFCALSVIAKIPWFHGKRFFEINKW
ncbi:ORM1-like protein 3 [Mactra antiquata]